MQIYCPRVGVWAAPRACGILRPIAWGQFIISPAAKTMLTEISETVVSHLAVVAIGSHVQLCNKSQADISQAQSRGSRVPTATGVLRSSSRLGGVCALEANEVGSGDGNVQLGPYTKANRFDISPHFGKGGHVEAPVIRRRGKTEI